ncbi:L-threonylcarbamoyladenylate synthase [soil metagenome]
MSVSTRIHSIDPDEPDPALLDEAAEILRRGGLVAFATETVYGLGADATNPEAVARIFEAKGRPANNPLIVHADGVAMARRCVSQWPPQAEQLSQHEWPGPLTMVLPRSAIIPDIVTAGLDTVGVRVPEPAVARKLIQRLGQPISAPSANRSTGISPTLAKHVLRDLDGRIDLILDSGPTRMGLESTVLDLTRNPPRILRPGPISAERLGLELAHQGGLDRSAPEPTNRPASPGQLAIHYAPRTPAVWVEPEQLPDFPWPERTALLVLGRQDVPPIAGPVQRIDLFDPQTASASLYAVLHELDEAGHDLIVVVPPPEGEPWETVRDRLRCATRPL